MGSIVTNTSNIVSPEQISSTDSTLIASKELTRAFGLPEDYVEMHIYTPDGTLVSSNYNFKGYTIPGNIQAQSGSVTTTNYLGFNPDSDITGSGFLFGTFDVQYNILRKKLYSQAQPVFFISEISSDRTEIRVISNVIASSDLESGSISFISELQSSVYFRDFLLDFGQNTFYVGTNLALDKNTSPFSLLIKLYQPLPSSVNINSSFWIVEELSNSYTYNVKLFPDTIEDKTPYLRSPNFDVMGDHHQIPPTKYYNYDTILSNLSLSTYQQVLNLINNSSAQINIDYTNYSDFIHFSSAKQRLLNFYYKVQSIENFDIQIGTVTSSLSPAASASIATLQGNINNIINNFDGYENYLYYQSSSQAYPKSGSTLPYVLYPSTSSIVVDWLGSDDSFNPIFGGQILTASLFDIENPNNLIHSVPEYILIDPANDGYQLFVQMIGQHFDFIWTYIKAVGDLYLTNNNLDYGISKDLVYDALRSLGIKLYNGKTSQDIFTYLLGINSSGSYSYQSDDTFDTVVSASAQTISGQDQVKEIFKRIYHNVPYILKTKGTKNSLRALSNLFGVPDTILRINTYGGVSELLLNSYQRYSYAFNTNGISNVSVPWNNNISSSYPDIIEFRFKPFNNISLYNNVQPLLISHTGSTTWFGLTLQNDSSSGEFDALINFGLYNGSTYSTLSFDAPVFVTSSLTDDTLWWNVTIERSSDSNPESQYQVSFNYVTDTGVVSNFSDLMTVSGTPSASFNQGWNTKSMLFYGGPDLSGHLAASSSIFSGSFQELRLWSGSNNVVIDHSLNPSSIQGITSGSFYTDLLAWTPLGNDLITGSIFKSIAPNPGYSNTFTVNNPQTNSFYSLVQTYYPVSVVAGNFTPVTDKVRIFDTNIIPGNVLSPYIRQEQFSLNYVSKDIHLVNVGFSPQSEIDEDIVSDLGDSFVIDDYIGDPTEKFDSTYSNLDSLKYFYFKKYTSPYDYKDYIKLIQNFDNSLFKMLADYVAGRDNIATGIVIKPTILERSKIKKYEPLFAYSNYTSSLGHYKIQDNLNFKTGYGDGDDLYTGDLSGSLIDIGQDFTLANHNPYLFGNGDIKFFPGSVYDVLNGNVSQNTLSTIRKRIDYNSLLVPVELQDFYYDYQRHIQPRYEGSKSTSLLYNVYSPASGSYPGDSSYGKTAAISSYAGKVGLFTEISQSQFLLNKSTVHLKYLVDDSGSFTDLNQRNKNWVEVQNTFIAGESLNVSLFNNQQYGNLRQLDGEKVIFNSGYRYDPIMYFSSSDSEMNFNYTSPQGQNSFFQYTNVATNIASQPTASIFTQRIIDVNGNFFGGIPAIYNVTVDGQYSFKANLDIDITAASTGLNASYQLDIIAYDPSGNILGDLQSVNKSFTSAIQNLSSSFSSPFSMDGSFPTSGHTFNINTYPGGGFYYAFTSAWTNLNNIGIGFGTSYTWTIGTISGDATGSYFIASTVVGATTYTTGKTYYNNSNSTATVYYTLNSLVTILEFDQGYSLTANLAAGSSVRFILRQLNLDAGMTANLEAGGIATLLIQGNNTFFSGPFIQSIVADTIYFTENLSFFFNQGIFLPQSSSLYGTYGDIYDTFTASPGDIVRIRYAPTFLNQEIMYTVSNVFLSGSATGSFLGLELSPTLPSGSSPSNINAVILLHRYNDETSIILNYNMLPYKSSYGLVVPDDIDPDVLNNIDTITKQINQKLINDTAINSVDGGAFS